MMDRRNGTINRILGKSTGGMAASAHASAIFGPFTPGDFLRAVRLYLFTLAAHTGQAYINLRVYNAKPANTTEAITEGRSLLGIDGSTTALVPVPVPTTLAMEVELPCGHYVDEDERFFGVVVYNGTTQALGCSAWIVAGEGQNVAPVSPVNE